MSNNILKLWNMDYNGAMFLTDLTEGNAENVSNTANMSFRNFKSIYTEETKIFTLKCLMVVGILGDFNIILTLFHISKI